MGVAARLELIRGRIAAAERRSGRQAGSVTLVAVSKGHPAAAVAAAYEAGHRDFGENRAEELEAKAAQLPDDIRWHFVGTLQRRKVGLVRPVTWMLHSLDRPSLVDRWATGGEGPPPPALLQVNLAAEPQKHGAAPADVPALVDRAIGKGVDCRGLMIIPPAPERAEDSRVWFERLAAFEQDLRAQYPTLTELSMGMTDDLEVAVEAGSTLVRVGRAIFGARGRTVQEWEPTGERGT